MKNAIILIDGENFRHKVEEVLLKEGVPESSVDYSKLKLKDLLQLVLETHKDINVKEIRYYAARLRTFPESLKKSTELIDTQRRLKTTLEKDGILFVYAGNVQRREIQNGKKNRYVFNEKGVDVKIAVDMVTLACDKIADIIILCSSDSDLQPAVKEAKTRSANIIYLGFSIAPNKGLQATTDESVLFRNQEIIDAITL